MIPLPALSNTVVSKRTMCFDTQKHITFPTKCRSDFHINFWIYCNCSLKQNWRINNLVGVQCVFCDVGTKGKHCFWDPQIPVVKTIAPTDIIGRWIRVWRWQTVKQPSKTECGLSLKRMVISVYEFCMIITKNSQNCLVELQLIDLYNGSTHCSLWSKNRIFMNTSCNVLVVTKWVI